MPISYSYRPRSSSRVAEQLRKNSKSVGLSILAIALIFSFSILSGRITGFVTYASDLESTLNETAKQLDIESQLRATCDSALASTKSGLSLCNDKLYSSQGYLVTCEKDRDDLSSYSARLNEQFSSCDAQREELNAKYTNETENYKTIVRNSVKAICCSFGDLQIGNSRNWGITNNQIVCGGNYTVNCTTGSTNY